MHISDIDVIYIY